MKYINDAATAVKEAKKDFGRYEHHNKFFFKCCPNDGDIFYISIGTKLLWKSNCLFVKK